jgi:hypothetical protein
MARHVKYLGLALDEKVRSSSSRAGVSAPHTSHSKFRTSDTRRIPPTCFFVRAAAPRLGRQLTAPARRLCRTMPLTPVHPQVVASYTHWDKEGSEDYKSEPGWIGGPTAAVV